MNVSYWLALTIAFGAFAAAVALLVVIAAAGTPDPPLPPRVMDRYRDVP